MERHSEIPQQADSICTESKLEPWMCDLVRGRVKPSLL